MNTEIALPPAVETQPAPEKASNRIPSFKVLEATETLDAESARTIRWLHSYYFDNNLGLEATAAAIGYDASTLSRVFHGRYNGSIPDVVKAILRFRDIYEERQSVNRAPFIKTALYCEIEECCQLALTYQKMVHLYGESQVGKTSCLRHYAETHNHGETVMVEMPVGGSLSHFMDVLAPKVRVNKHRDGGLAISLLRSLGPNNLLIVDEASRALQARAYGGKSLKTLDFIRALHDTSGCGVVLCGTNVFRDQMADRGLEKFLNQLNRRCLLRRQLPDKPSLADLNAFARHYQLEPAMGEARKLQMAVIAEHGLGVWLTTLTSASRKATKEKKPLTWDHVLKAHAFFRSMENPQQEAA